MTAADLPASAVKLLSNAADVISVDRAATHGSAEDSFDKIAEMWNAWLTIRAEGALTSVDVTVMMDLFKTARIAGNPGHRDNWLDKVGYTALGYQMLINRGEDDGRETAGPNRDPRDKPATRSSADVLNEFARRNTTPARDG